MELDTPRPIGGYFEWEFPRTIYPIPHEDGFLVNNARSALQLILQSIGTVKKVYLPYFTCDSVAFALQAIGCNYQQYHIDNNLHIAESINLDTDEYIIYTNYFGIMDKYCNELVAVYGEKLIVDNAQALYASHLLGTHSVYSYRKYIGVPDGGAAISNTIKSVIDLPITSFYDRCGALLARVEDNIPTGYQLFKENDRRFRRDDMAQMSVITKKILRSINHNEIIIRRRENFAYLHNQLKDKNQLLIPDLDSFACPMVYPFYATDETLRQILIENKIFVAQYWPNVLENCAKDTIEYNQAIHIIALPIDQRYGIEQMDRIINVIDGCYET